jgi:hypothetical protein
MNSNILKTYITIFGIALLFTSCQKNEDTSYEVQGFDELTSTNAMTPIENATCYITALVIDIGPCDGIEREMNNNEREYSVYVTSSLNRVSYDRDVSVAIVHENTWVDTKVLRIPANEFMSEKQRIVQDAQENYGDITLDVVNVKKSNGEQDASCVWRDTSPTINNCFYKVPVTPIFLIKVKSPEIIAE